jgi:hypothetical protein
VRLAVRTLDNGDVEYLKRGASGDWEVFTRVALADAAMTRPTDFSDDGGTLYWRDDRGRDTAAVVAEDLATGATRLLAEDPNADCTHLELEPLSRRPFAAASTLARIRWHVIEPTYAAHFAALGTVSSGGLNTSRDLRRDVPRATPRWSL